MIKVKQVGIYTLSMDNNFNYYISNGNITKGGFKACHINPLMGYSDKEFIEFCEVFFN